MEMQASDKNSNILNNIDEPLSCSQAKYYKFSFNFTLNIDLKSEAFHTSSPNNPWGQLWGMSNACVAQQAAPIIQNGCGPTVLRANTAGWLSLKEE